jgi:hypothetical protein
MFPLQRSGPVARLFLLFAGVFIQLCLGAPPSLDGIWQTEGYGYIFLIKGSTLTAFETTTSTCVQGLTARRKTRTSAPWEAVFRSKHESTLFFRSSGVGDHGILHLEDSVPDISIRRITKMPASCGHPTEDTPTGNFEVFTRTWAENYISFTRRHVDWNSVVAQYRGKVTGETTPAQLFDIFQSMIKPLGDLHTYITAPTLKRASDDYFRTGTDRIFKGGDDRFAERVRWQLFAITNRKYLQRPPRMFCRRNVQFGYVNDTTGYLRFLAFSGYSRHNDLEALEAALDTIFSDSKLKALIIDVRLSFGGSDQLGLAIARRLTTEAYVAYTVYARSNPIDPELWTSGDRIIVRPSSRPGFHGPVVELIGPITMSAAETFSQALMARSPHVIRVGDYTQGVFCDVLDRHLPNGWKFGLPNAVYKTADRQAFDVLGIPPDIDVPVFVDGDVSAGNDPAMIKAIEVIPAGKP